MVGRVNLHEELRTKVLKQRLVSKFERLIEPLSIEHMYKKNKGPYDVAYRSEFRDGKTIDTHMVFSEKRLYIDAEGIKKIDLPLTAGGIKKFPNKFRKLRREQILFGEKKS